MLRSSARPSVALRRLLVGFQVFLLVATLFAPLPVAAVDPSPSPDPSASAPADPTPDPAPVATPDPTPDPTAAPAATPDPTVAPNPTTAPAPDPTVAPDPTTVPAPDPTVAPDPTIAPSADPASPAPDQTTAPTSDPSTAPVYHPTIASDLADYPPGGLVTLTGTGWQPGESVHIFVNDDWGSSWSRNVDVVADASGQIVDSFNLPNWFVATYSVTATGAVSGVATTTFTDSNMRVQISPGGSGGVTGTHSFSWDVYNTNNCTGSIANSGPTTVGTSFTLIAAVTTSPAQSLKITAPAISGWVFSNWTKGSTTLTGNPGCLLPDANNGTDNWSANYLAVTNRATTTSIARTVGVNPSTYGATVTFTATVAATPAPGTTGTVTFKDGPTVLCGSVSLAANQAACSPTLAAGGHTITAEYSGGLSGTDQFLPSTSTGLAHTVNKKALSVNAVANSKTYGAADPAFTWTYSGFITGESDSNVVITGSANCSRASGETVLGSPYAITCAPGSLLADNYSFVTGSSADFTINAKDATWTTNANSKTYGAADPSPLTTGSGTGFLAADGVSATYSRASGETVLGGPYHITATLSATVAGALSNYNITNTGAAFTINKANPNIVVHGYNVVWDNLPHTATGAATGVFGESLAGLDLSGTTHTALGTYADSWTFTDVTGNYNNASGSVTDTITTAFRIIGFDSPVDMTALGQPRNYNSVKNGQTVPLKFRVFNVDGTEVTSVSGLTAMARTVTCATGDVDPTLLPIDSTADNGLNRTGDRFHFNWAVPKGAGKCYQVLIRTVDGSTVMVGSMSGTPIQEAYFKSK